MHVWSGVRSFEGAVVLKAPSRDWQHSANAIPGALPEPLRTYAALSISPLRAECTHPRSRVSQSLLPDRLSSHRERVATEASERAPSGTRLREWMGLARDVFYDPAQVAILPMGFCYPGTGRSGDLAPRPECADAWRSSLLEQLEGVKLTLVIGQYAARWHLATGKESLTATVKNWKQHRPSCLPLPHPSPRNNIWLKKNPWFSEEVLPYLRSRVRRVLR